MASSECREEMAPALEDFRGGRNSSLLGPQVDILNFGEGCGTLENDYNNLPQGHLGVGGIPGERTCIHRDMETWGLVGFESR